MILNEIFEDLFFLCEWHCFIGLLSINTQFDFIQYLNSIIIENLMWLVRILRKFWSLTSSYDVIFLRFRYPVLFLKRAYVNNVCFIQIILIDDEFNPKDNLTFMSGRLKKNVIVKENIFSFCSDLMFTHQFFFLIQALRIDFKVNKLSSKSPRIFIDVSWQTRNYNVCIFYFRFVYKL